MKSQASTQNAVSAMRFVRALLICGCFFALAFGPTIANAQTFVSQSTTTTLWSGSQDVTQFGLTGLTAPSSGLILQGTAISAFTGKPVRHLWYGDAFNGLCRIDPEVDDPIATPLNGVGSFNVNLLTCLGSIQNAPFAPGALTFDASSNNIYTEDTGRTTAGILRAHYIPSGDNGQGSLDLIHVDSLVGTQNTRNPFGGCPQLTDPKTGIPVPFVPNSAAIGPDGNLYTGSVHDGAILRIIGPATFNPATDCVNPGDTGQNPNAKLQIPILSADERVGSGRTFGLGWIGHTLFGADDIAPWILFNADQCLTPVNGNKICAAPVLGGAAPGGVEILASQVAMPRGGAASDAVFPSYSGKVIYFATAPSVTRVANVASATNMTANLNYGGSFSFISGLTPDAADPNNATVYVASDPTQGDISGAGQIWKITQGPSTPAPPATPVLQSAAAGPGTGQATVTWAPTQNGQPISTYTVETLLASTTGGAPVPSAIPNVTANAPSSFATISGLTVGTAYVFEVEACNATGCSALSAPSSPVTALAMTAPTAPTNVTGVDAGNGASAGISWTLSSNGNSPILSSTIITNAPAGASPVANTIVTGSGNGGVVTGLSCGNSYTFQVFATNAMGNSQTSATSTPLAIACVSAADVAATESAPGTVNAGSQVTFTISVKNNGPASAPSVTFSNTLPAPLVSYSATQGVCTSAPGSTAFSCNLLSMAAGSTATVAITVQLPPNQTSGSFTNTVTVNATNTGGTNVDPNLTNNTATATVSISNPCATSTTDIQTTGSAQNGNPIHGTADTFTWQIKNNQGSVAANCVTFSATTTAPAGATLALNSASSTIGTCSILNNAVSCNIGAIPGGQTAIVSVTATPSSAGAANSYTMTGRAQLGPGSTDTNTANNSFTVLIGAQ